MKFLSLAIIVLPLFLQQLPCRAQVIGRGDTNEVIRLNKQAWDASANDLQLSLKFAAEAIRISHQLNYQKGLSYSFNIYGTYYKTKGNYMW